MYTTVTTITSALSLSLLLLIRNVTDLCRYECLYLPFVKLWITFCNTKKEKLLIGKSPNYAPLISILYSYINLVYGIYIQLTSWHKSLKSSGHYYISNAHVAMLPSSFILQVKYICSIHKASVMKVFQIREIGLRFSK